MSQWRAVGSPAVSVHLREGSGSVFPLSSAQVGVGRDKVLAFALSKHSQAPRAPAPCPAQWPPLDSLHYQYPSCSVEAKPGHATPDVVSEVPNRGEGSRPLTCWLCSY